jgi:hypothetical protein
MEIDEWREVAYNKMFNNTQAYVTNLRENDPKFTIEDLQAMLNSEYDRLGLAWDGRGEVVEINIEATIAAFQHELIKWRKDIKEKVSL